MESLLHQAMAIKFSGQTALTIIMLPKLQVLLASYFLQTVNSHYPFLPRIIIPLRNPGSETEFWVCLKLGGAVLYSFNKLLYFYQQKFDCEQS